MPSGGAHGAVVASAGEQLGPACAVPGARVAVTAVRPPVMKAAVATAATNFPAIAVLSSRRPIGQSCWVQSQVRRLLPIPTFCTVPCGAYRRHAFRCYGVA